MVNDLEWSSVSTTCLATKKSILWNGKLVPERSRGCIDTEVELLSEILPCPKLWPHIPHTYIIEGHVNCSPWIRVYLHQTPSSDHLNIETVGEERQKGIDAHLSCATSDGVPKIVLVSARLRPLATIHAKNRTVLELEVFNHRLRIKH